MNIYRPCCQPIPCCPRPGVTGPTGPQEPQGPQGIQGPAGPTGPSIKRKRRPAEKTVGRRFGQCHFTGYGAQSRPPAPPDERLQRIFLDWEGLTPKYFL